MIKFNNSWMHWLHCLHVHTCALNEHYPYPLNFNILGVVADTKFHFWRSFRFHWIFTSISRTANSSKHILKLTKHTYSNVLFSAVTNRCCAVLWLWVFFTTCDWSITKNEALWLVQSPPAGEQVLNSAIHTIEVTRHTQWAVSVCFT